MRVEPVTHGGVPAREPAADGRDCAVVENVTPVAFSRLGLTRVPELPTRVLLLLPQPLVDLQAPIFGSCFGRCVGNAVQADLRKVGVSDTELLGRIAQ